MRMRFAYVQDPGSIRLLVAMGLVVSLGRFGTGIAQD